MSYRNSAQTVLAVGTALALAAVPHGGVTAQSPTGTVMAITAKEKQQGS